MALRPASPAARAPCGGDHERFAQRGPGHPGTEREADLSSPAPLLSPAPNPGGPGRNVCGLAGAVESGAGRSSEELHALARAMADTLSHRGPDDWGTWADAGAGIALGHRRLSIVDLSEAGHQPMVSADERFVITYNGEVYNADELRAELEAEGKRFRGHSDTEVILEGFASWGAERLVERLIGMFAFAVWDRRERALSLVRDRIGIKPLYWAQQGDLFLFGSELKALCAWPGFGPEIDRDALGAYFRWGYVPAPRSIYRGVQKLRPGHRLTLSANGQTELVRYWDLGEVARAGLADRLDASDEEATDALEALLRDAVRRRMIADVPLGAFLSGGIDSSAVVALMQAESDRPVRTFTIGFHEPGFDEATHAKAIAGHLGTDHTELYVESGHALSIVPRIPHWFDEPFSDSSQIPTYLVSEMTRQHVTVALSGDGGDELFAGYANYARARDLWERVGRGPDAFRGAAASLLESVVPGGGDGALGLLPGALRPAKPGHRLNKLARMLRCRDVEELYRVLLRRWDERVVFGAGDDDGGPWEEDGGFVPDLVERLEYLDTLSYLPDDILTKVDRASMAVSLEARVPVLDHRVVEFSWRVPPSMKVREGQTKWLLQQVLHRHVPKNLVERPKMGFGVPIGAWLRGPLRDWAETLLDEARLEREGYLDPAPVRRKWQEHLDERADWDYALWDVLMFQAWLEEHAP